MKKLLLMCCAVATVAGAYENHRAAYQAGRKFFNAGKAAECIKAQNEAAKLAKNSEEFYNAKINASDAALRLKDYKQAEKYVDEILAKKDLPKHPLAVSYWQKGNILSTIGNRAAAKEFWKKAMEVKSGTWVEVSSTSNLAWNYCRDKNYAQALKLYQQIQTLPQADINAKITAILDSSDVEMARRNYAGAAKFIAEAEKMLQDKKLNIGRIGRYYFCLGYMYYAQNKLPEAIKTFQKLAKYPKMTPYYINRAQNFEAMSYYYLKQYKKAKELMDQVKNPISWMKKRVDDAYKKNVK